MSKFSIVIPLIPAHDRELKRLFNVLACEVELIKEVIICRSETKSKEHEKRIKFFQKLAKRSRLDVPIIFSPVSGVARDGTNRNRGWDLSSGKYVAFIDADDLYSKNRLTILDKIFEQYGFQAVIHNYSETGEVVSPLTLLAQNIDAHQVVFPKSVDTEDLKVSLRSEKSGSIRIHHAHLTLVNDKSITARYKDIFPGADTEFCKRLVVNNKKVGYVDLQLSSWNRRRNLRYKIRLVKHRLLGQR